MLTLKDTDNKQHVVTVFKNVLDGVFSTEDMTDEKLEKLRVVLNLAHIDYVVNKKKVVTKMNEHDSIFVLSHDCIKFCIKFQYICL